jgi:hypothetical protein
MNSWIFFGAYVMLLHAMDSIFTHGNSGFGQKFKTVLMPHIEDKITNRWTFFANYISSFRAICAKNEFQINWNRLILSSEILLGR